ncbi:hypothetical protein CHS0354_020413 [Potamilus streckersoni]|uniref:Mitogen-activated protein kinase-binding protein 1 n=1 Tax=Potamilus streckersoni TaxID=2493646 RepID=A0AAE0SV32_9BIVA|nr:hypothetical protein CHS0354_020413 [Potamilus streckersoni]
MLSCGADKSLLFRNAQIPECQFVLHQHLVGKNSLYDMDVDPSHKFAVTACQDRNLRIYNIKTAKHKKNYKASLTDDGVLIRVQLDPSGSYAVTSCTDKNLCFLDFYTGELLATIYGHSEVATAVKFMNDFKRLITVSGDGCIFVWRLPVEMTKQIQSRLKELDKLPLGVSLNSVSSKREDILSPSLGEDHIDAQTMDIDEGQFITPQKVLNKLKEDSPDFNTSPSLEFRTSVSQLPTWARARQDTGSQDNSIETTSTTQQSKDTSSQQARGRWAQRVENLGIVIKSHDGKTIEVDPSSDRPRFTYEADELSKQLADIRRETMVLDHPEVIPKNIPVIFDDETNDDDDDDDFFPTFHKKEKTNRDSNVWEDLYNLDNDELEQPSDAEIIYYPTSEGSDTLASYRVFAAKDDGDTRLRSRLSKHSFTSLDRSQDADSESTDPISLDDAEEDEDSGHSAGPTTPMEDPKTPNRERFLKDAFENLSFTPQLSIEKFECGLDNLEKEISQDPLASSRMINSRLSISARFLSRSQQDRNRNVAVQRQDNWFDSVQRNKDEMARKLDEAKQRLQAMGWKSASPEEEHNINYEPGPPVLDPTLTPSKMSSALADDFENQKTPTNFQLEQTYSLNRLKEENDRPSSPKTPKSLRRCWSILDLPKQPIPEELATGAEPLSVKAPGSKNSGDDGMDDGLNTPTTVSKTARPRSLSLGRDESNQKETKPNKERSKQHSRISTSTATRTTPSNMPKKVDNNANKMSLTNNRTKQRQSKPSTNLSKSKSTSMQSLSISKELSTIKGKTVKEVPIKGKDWAEPKLSSYSSEPDLLLSDEENFEKYDYNIGPPRSGLNSDMSKSVPDFSAEYKLARKGPHLSLVSDSNRNSTGNTNTQKARQGTTGRSSLSSTFKTGTEEQKSTPPSTATRKSTGSTCLKKEDSRKEEESHKKDKELMPPPSIVGAPRGKQDKFTKKTVQTKRKPSELTLDQAKNILLGKSGILNGDSSTGDKEKHKRELPSLSSSNNVSKSSNASSDKIHSIENDSLSDPKFLSVASEIESTAAELRLISALNVNPDDLPERDIPTASQVPPLNKSPLVSSSAQSIGKNYLSKDVVIVDLNSQKHSKEIRSLDSSFSSQDEELSSSPSVKERIAQLNRSTDQHCSSSPLRERNRDTSPLPVKYTTASPRITSSCSMTISTSSGAASHISNHTATTTMTSVTGATVFSSATIPHVLSHGKIQDFRGHSAFHAFQHSSEGDQSSLQSASVGAVMENSKSSTAKVTEAGSGVVNSMPGNMHSVPGPSMIISSSDTELPPKHLSPGSSHSPRSTTDTGVGSDTDTELNNSVSQTSFRQLKIQSIRNDGHLPSDSLILCEAAIEDMMRVVRNATELYHKISSHQDMKSLEASKRMKDAFQDTQNTLACLTQSRQSAPDISKNVISTRDLPHKGSIDLPPETVTVLEKFMEPVLYNLTDTLTRTISDKLTDISDSMNGKLSVMSDLLKRRIDNLP